MLRVFEDADNNPFAAILEELDPPCPHVTSCAHSAQLAAYAPKATPKHRRCPKMDFDMAL